MDNQNIPVVNFDHGRPVQTPSQQPPKKRQVFAWLKYKHSQLGKKQKILVAVGLVILVVVGSIGGYVLYKQSHKAPLSSNSQPAPAKTTEPSRLTGVEINPELNKRPVTGVMIENSLVARPQSGLKDAGIVFEAIAEGGITRFLALYMESQPKSIGPVRSVRPYYLDWLMPFEASIAHVGGAPAALKDIKRYDVRDLDQFSNSGAYERINSRSAPHNVYTTSAKLDKLNDAKDFDTSEFTGFARKRKEGPFVKVKARTINFTISSFHYNVRYDYNAKTNSYNRREGGAKHLDKVSGKILSPKVVIALVMTRGIASDGQHTKYGTTGSGRAYFFQDGQVVIGTWKKKGRETQLQFLSKDLPVELNPGQTWITMVDSRGSVSYKP
ncbi:MAG TPA: DUF3048 domain-containing protein [Candidatus Saccharimonadales bacterium]|nr:DUF3048 domain-containing protein [Candidatus Saccharimonadales bacterium]